MAIQRCNRGPIHERRSRVRRRKPFALNVARAMRLIHETCRKICGQSHVRLSMGRRGGRVFIVKGLHKFQVGVVARLKKQAGELSPTGRRHR